MLGLVKYIIYYSKGEGFFKTPIYSYLIILYSDVLEQKIGYIEACMGLG